MPIKTRNIDELALQAGTLYEAVVIIAKRSRQVSTNLKKQLDDKLSYFEGFDNDLDDIRLTEEQSRVSVEFEKKPKPNEFAIDEMLAHEIYFRQPDE